MTTNFNTNPYFDDFDESKNFHRVLFKPGVSVQARELTQLQTILQNQVSRFGRHFFKEGAMVIPGGISVDTNVGYVKVASTYNSTQVETYLNSFLGTDVSNANGVIGRVVAVSGVAGTDPITLFVKYIDSGSTNTGTAFAASDVITSTAGPTVAATVTEVGTGSIASIAEGVYFVKDAFVRVEAQTIVLEKYSDTPTYRIGLLVDERLISSADDESLLDNASGSPNFAAPGADRYQLVLTLEKLDIDSELDQDFTELARIEDGELKVFVDTTDYSIFERTLARRTYDESGDYTVRKFQIQPRESRNNNRGDWVTGTAYLIGDVVEYNGNTYVAKSNFTSGSNPAADTTNWRIEYRPFYNNGVYSPEAGGDSANLAIGLEPGKAYVRGYEIEKIATEYLNVPKARSYKSVTDDILNTNIGNYILVKNHAGYVDCTRFGDVVLYDQFTANATVAAGSVVGNARVRYFEHHNGTPGNADTEYKLSLFDVRMDSGKTFERDVKQIYSSDKFTSDISPTLITLSGAITASGTSVTGSGTLFLSELKVGDYISANSNIRRVTAIANDNALTVNTSLTVTGSVFSRVETRLQETDKTGLLFRLPYTNIRETASRTYTSLQRYDATADGSGVVTITTATTQVGGTTSATSFSSALESTDYVVINRSTWAVQNPSISVVGGQLIISGLSAGTAYSVYVPAFKSGSQSDVKTKTLVSNEVKTFTAEEVKANKLSLGKADVYRIISIVDDGGTDLYSWYNLDDGQRSTHYGLGKVVRKPGYPIPSTGITVTFDYFSHGTGDHFAKESYVNIRPEDIPAFTMETGTIIRLSDVLDFRPRINDAGTGFTGTGASLTQMPYRTAETQLDYSYYLGRIDKIALDENGRFFVIQGTPSLNPSAPDDSSIAMTLYTLRLNPYTYSEKDIQVFYVDNKRYTMRDIGRLEQRIKSIEYYTSLSLLEQDTKNLVITDGFGLDRFKNGFIVDNFTGHSVGDVWQPDYRCSIDMQTQTLRPQFKQQNVKLIPVSNVNIQITGDIATLPYDHVVMVDQPYASRTENINPYSVFTFIGRTDLHPSTDEWFETERRPDIINEQGNLDSILAQAESVGLGTVWNNWTTSWTGVQTSSFSEDFGRKDPLATDILNTLSESEQQKIQSGRGGIVTGTTTTATSGLTRTGVNTSVNILSETRSVDDRVVSTSIIPFIRSRHLLFRTHGLKPNTKFFAFFDGVGIGSYITPATKLTLTSVVGDFDYTTNAGANADQTARRFGQNTQTAYDRGDVVTQAVSGATGVVAYADNTDLYLVNVKGTFNTTNTITGSISGATAQPVSVSVGSSGGELITSAKGDVVGVFVIPNNNSIKFRTGSREFKLTTSETNDSSTRGSLSRAKYDANGILETKQATITSVRNAELVQTQVVDNRIETSTRLNDLSVEWVDPLAQTFLVQQDGGAFLTKVDVFFQSKDSNLPVTLQIREVVNGYPGQRVLPFSTVIKRASDVVISADGTVATTFTFESPVYVQNASEYAIVLLSDSNEYNVWISQIGEVDVASDRLISNQPYMGVLFKSQNASTWTAEQTQDLKFRLYRASFTALEGTLTFNNDKVDSASLDSNPIQTANGTPLVRVFHPNHNFSAGDNVLISGAVAGNGITADDLNKEHTLANVLLDSYVITLANAATSSGRIGGTGIVADQNVGFDVINPIIQSQNFGPTTIDYDAESVLVSTGSPETFILQANQNTYMDEPRVIWSETNEGGTKSFELNSTFRSTQENLSPVIDLSRCSLVAIRNRVDCPLVLDSTNSYNVPVLDDRAIVSGNTTISFSGNVLSSTDSTVQAALKTINVGKKIGVSGSPNNSGDFIVYSVNDTTGAVTITGTFNTEGSGNATTIVSRENFVDELAPSGGSSSAKYIQRQVQFNNPSTYLKVLMALNSPNECGVDVYYKTTTTTSGVGLDQISWTKLEPTTPIVKTSDSRVFTDVEYEQEGIPEFNVVVIKIVMRALNSSIIPTIKDLRVIGCA